MFRPQRVLRSLRTPGQTFRCKADAFHLHDGQDSFQTRDFKHKSFRVSQSKFRTACLQVSHQLVGQSSSSVSLQPALSFSEEAHHLEKQVPAEFDIIVISRTSFFVPVHAPGGPNPDLLTGHRLTQAFCKDGLDFCNDASRLDS